jgi:hypothetical protein
MLPPPEPVGSDAVEHVFLPVRGKGQRPHNRQGLFGAAPRMADLACGLVLLPSSDVVEDRRNQQHRHIGTLDRSDAPAEAEDAFGVLPVMAAPGAVKKVSRLDANGFHQCRLAGVVIGTFGFGVSVKHGVKNPFQVSGFRFQANALGFQLET